VLGELPVVCLAEEIDTPGEGQVRALITLAGNPAISTPNSDRLDAALSTLDFMISVDVYVNETTRHADVILPAPSPLRRGHYDLVLYLFAVRNVANYSPPVLDPDPALPDEWVTLLRLAGVAAGLSLAALEAAPHGIDLGPLQPRLPGALRTRSGRIELAPEPLVADVARLREALDRPSDDGPVLVGRRHLRSNNSWMHNLPML